MIRNFLSSRTRRRGQEQSWSCQIRLVIKQGETTSLHPTTGLPPVIRIVLSAPMMSSDCELSHLLQ